MFAGLAAFLTTRSTSLYGPGISPDSAGYSTLAQDISANGFAFLKENKAVAQPPLYPIALAAISSLTGASAIRAALWINVLCSAALVAVILCTVSRVTMSIPVLTLTGVLSSFSIPLTHVWSMAWTEPLFLLTVYLTLLIVTEPRHPACSALLAGLLTAAACFTRYAGIPLIPVVSLFLFLSQAGSVWNRCKFAVLYALPPTIFVALYVFRNHAVSGTPFGGRFPGQLGIAANISLVKDVVLAWFLPMRIRTSEALLLLMCALILAVTWHCRHHIAKAIRDSGRIVHLCAAFSIAYTAFIVWTSKTTAYDPIDDRLLSPLYPSLIILTAALLKPQTWCNQIVRSFAIGAFCLLCVVAPLRATCLQVNRNASHGAGGYNSRDWQESETVTYFRQNKLPKQERVFSNTPEALSILADVSARMSPARREYNSEVPTGVSEDNLFRRYSDFDGALLVWFQPNRGNFLFTLEELQNICDLKEIKALSDGTIYRIRGSKKRIESGNCPE